MYDNSSLSLDIGNIEAAITEILGPSHASKKFLPFLTLSAAQS